MLPVVKLKIELKLLHCLRQTHVRHLPETRVPFRFLPKAPDSPLPLVRAELIAGHTDSDQQSIW